MFLMICITHLDVTMISVYILMKTATAAILSIHTVRDMYENCNCISNVYVS